MFTNRPKLKKLLKRLLLTFFVIVLVILGLFLRWRQKEITRLRAGSQLIQTSKGLIEYSTFGSGPTVLVLHGTIGGYDQAQTLAEMVASDDYQFISVSRPGYLQTPLVTGPSFSEQADAYAALLDELGIDQVALMAISGGGPSAMQFALRYPERTWGVIMIAANSDVEIGRAVGENLIQDDPSAPPQWVLKLIFSDYFSWLVTTGAKQQPTWLLPSLVGEAYEETVSNDPAKFHLYTGFVGSFSLLSQRRIGSFNDGQQFLSYSGFAYETVSAPMLLLHGSEDSQSINREMRHLDEVVPNSTFFEIEGGTHFMPISHNDELSALIQNFLEENRPFP